MNTVLTIAGSDCSGGAGIQADIKTITAHKLYAMSVITALTAQNTTGVYGICNTPPEFVKKQLDCIFTDIFPDSVKIGMVANEAIIKVIAEQLRHYNAKNIVIDPVMVSSSGTPLMSDEARVALEYELMPLASLITPNLAEAEVLCGFAVKNKADMISAAKDISARFSCSALVKGGHLNGCSDDILYDGENITEFSAKRINNPNTHGTGCTLSSAIACGLARGDIMSISVANAKEYLTGAIGAMLDLGHGSGPLDHMFSL
ncbi:MAG: bifunctional hydroxymethylpyrimidine kinase/phosphomethylpyrimidine kinase [Clostridiales bacterium]|nr:bifunctional hydroxymethylpyrimidine kinase/phosphomethylpyrimidine kinase [Clostridiales bacterium]